MTTTTTTSAALGHQIAELRSKLGLTQFKVAAQASVTMPTLRRIESGDNVRVSSLFAVLDALGCELSITFPSSGSQPDSEAPSIPCSAPRT